MASGFLLEQHQYTVALWQMDCSAGNEAIVGSCAGPLKAAWLAYMHPIGRMKQKLKAQALEPDSPGSELQNDH